MLIFILPHHCSKIKFHKWKDISTLDFSIPDFSIRDFFIMNFLNMNFWAMHAYISRWVKSSCIHTTYQNIYTLKTLSISQTSLLNLTFQSQITFGKSSWLVVISSLLDFLFWYLLSSKLSRWTIVFKTLISSSDSEFCGKVTEGAFWSPK